MARAFLVRLAHAALILLAPLAAAPALEAQGIFFVPAGQRVRVASPAFSGSGYAAWATDDTLTLAVNRQPAPVALPLASISSLEARRTNTPREGALRKFYWGTLAGIAAFGISNLFVDYEEQYPNREGYTSLSRGGAIALYVGGGTVLGAAWGILRPGGRWERAQPPMRVRVTPAEQ